MRPRFFGRSHFSVHSVFLLPSRRGRAEPSSATVRSAAKPGFVLVAALVALVIIALLVTGAFFASGQEMIVARNELRDQQAFSFAEYAAAKALEGWSAPARDSMIAGQTQRLGALSRGLMQSDVIVTKLDTALYLVTAVGTMRSADAAGLRRRIGILVRTIRDGVQANPPVRVSGEAWSELY